MTEKSVLMNIVVAVVAFTGGWFAHQELHPFLPSSQPVANKKIASPGQVSSQTRLIYSAGELEKSVQTKILVERVTVLQELSDSILLEVRYHYEGEAPANEVKLFVGLESQYLYLGNDTVHAGDGVLRLAVGLIDSDMKRDGVQGFQTDRMNITFEHYPPGAYRGVLSKTVFPYVKKWHLPS